MIAPLLQYYTGERPGLSLLQIIIIVLLCIFLIAAIRGSRPIAKVLSHWHHRFEQIQFTPEEFYELLGSILAKKEMNKVGLGQISYSQGGILSPKRKYLRIQYGTLVFDVCASPFAREFFVSWWFGEVKTLNADFLVNLPIIGKYFVPRPKTFFEIDTEMMFKESVSACVKETIDQLTQTKGMRQLSDTDWNEYNRNPELSNS